MRASVRSTTSSADTRRSADRARNRRRRRVRGQRILRHGAGRPIGRGNGNFEQRLRHHGEPREVRGDAGLAMVGQLEIDRRAAASAYAPASNGLHAVALRARPRAAADDIVGVHPGAAKDGLARLADAVAVLSAPRRWSKDRRAQSCGTTESLRARRPRHAVRRPHDAPAHRPRSVAATTATLSAAASSVACQFMCRVSHSPALPRGEG